MLGKLGDRPLGAKDADAVGRALDVDPVASCMVAARVEAYGLSPRFLGGELWTNSNPGSSLAFSGANLMPLIGGLADLDLFAGRAVDGPRVCSSVVGSADLVLPLWDRLAPEWGPPREIRDDQPLLALNGYPTIATDPAVGLVTMADLDAYFPAAVEMFIGEVGVDPCAGDGGRSYRRRLAALISARRVFARFEGERVVFKAEIGSMSRKAGQIQGVWVDPEFRGRGLGAVGTAAVAAAIARQGRIASLYVNAFNTAARRTYEQVGFREVGTFATVLID
ncbi:GNAT family N-acetyltransferase [Gordonia sp. (in: high G+C Gram-positive bacteria)]|uniref:GNAT family N-acetyltransferase n=1 Tax=Gordonia sp. (in: high G+C Gram-positive bacteria) TaxID=84139 RepID=UPI0016A10514|nr:GNAT family N-acetyltransferase [Gordonia sp. (in: high G+C Gram-positive bacteria)]NLG47074.1 GNAT family N-acetyltransferase [Gordonia sp. (in: high G+C Gram-positive bacteria)]